MGICLSISIALERKGYTKFLQKVNLRGYFCNYFYEDKNTKERQGQYHHPRVQQKHGGQRSAERTIAGQRN